MPRSFSQSPPPPCSFLQVGARVWPVAPLGGGRGSPLRPPPPWPQRPRPPPPRRTVVPGRRLPSACAPGRRLPSSSPPPAPLGSSRGARAPGARRRPRLPSQARQREGGRGLPPALLLHPVVQRVGHLVQPWAMTIHVVLFCRIEEAMFCSAIFHSE